jgi:hypothetical protein
MPQYFEANYTYNVAYRLKAGSVERAETFVASEWLGKHVPAATDSNATMYELLEEVFSMLSASRLYKK